MKKVFATVREYERDKIYRLNRKLDGLYELLETLDNTTIQFKNPEKLQEDIKRDIEDCKKKIQKWWNVIGQKYHLAGGQHFSVLFATGDIVRN